MKKCGVKQKHVIWSNISCDYFNYEDWREDLESEYPDLTDDERYQIMIDTNWDYLADERFNLDLNCGEPILVIADLGPWSGRVSSYKELDSGKISDCLYTNCDYAEWYLDEIGDLRCKEIHHDGTNYLLYRAYKAGVTEKQKELLRDKILSGTMRRKDITRITRRLGDDVAKVYGWRIYKAG